jgi:hypothetical protein
MMVGDTADGTHLSGDDVKRFFSIYERTDAHHPIGEASPLAIAAKSARW